MLIDKYQLNNCINSEVNFQKMQIPVFMLYSKLLCKGHTIPKLEILQSFAEWSIELIEMFSRGRV